MWVPPAAQSALVAERRQHIAELAQEKVVLHGELERWNRMLKAVDPYLELVKASETATTPGLVPGYFHVLRHIPGGPPAIFPIEGPQGEFMEPDSGLFDRLARSDMWSNRSLGAKRKRELDAQRDKARGQEREAQERLDELADRWRSANRPQVLFSDVKRTGVRR